MLGLGLGIAAPRGRPDPLGAFYSSGAILAHYSTDRVTRDGAGAITGFTNLGGAGASRDATVSGPALAQQGSTAVFPSGGTSFGQIAAPLDLIGVRLMWIASVPDPLPLMRFFGNPTPEITIIRLAQNTTNMVVATSAGTVTMSPAPVWPIGLAVHELESTSTQLRLFINGAQVSSAAHSFAALPVSTFGAANNTGQNFVGRMGEILGIVLGRSDTDAAITAARTRLNARVVQG